MRILQDRKVAVHPWMNVALYGEDFVLVVFLGDGRSPGRLRFVPLAVEFRERVDVVRGLVFVSDFDFLIDLEGQDMRNVAATLLGEDRGRGRRGVIRSAGRT